ncbi:MAG: sigma-70 family RNA polymerase sigma factor [Acidobacteriota bacterium]|nr:sigma-70 family RNA polymerase sigma factor [Acidobacteriota bacterium]
MSSDEIGRMREITQLLQDWDEADETSRSRLMELIYDELCRLAQGRLRKERRDHTLQTAALVHEAYLRLVDQRHVRWQSRAHFFAVASTMMRRVLINHARDRSTAKRGGGAPHLQLDERLLPSGNLGEGGGEPRERWDDWLALDQALSRLAEAHPQQARAVELRYFAGLGQEEIAEVLGLSRATVTRRLRVARAWLYRHLRPQASPAAAREGRP